MADPLQLRTCQEVLGKLPEKQSIWGSALWPFLKGVEGFDTERASDCLVKLLNNHYDTIAVLQLAEKRDLVEDAGILPGDALRIIRAARDYVPRPPDSRLSEPPTPTSNAYRPPAMRDLTGILTSPRASDATFQAFPQQQQPSALDSTFQAFPQQQQPSASDSTFQAIPQQEKGAAISQQGAPKSEAVRGSSVVDDTPSASMPTAPPPPPPSASQRITARSKTINYPHTCRWCNAKCPGEVQYLSHYTGQKHIVAVIESKKTAQAAKMTKAAAQAVSEPSSSNPKDAAAQVVSEPSSSNPKDAAPLHACGVCNVRVDSEIILRSHFNGKRHAENMELAMDSKDNRPTDFLQRPTNFLHCSVCDITCLAKWNLVEHFNGKKHVQNMKEDSDDDEDSSYYSE